jgi:tyrosinase-like protein
MALGDGIRRNVATISPEERNRLRDAMITLQQRSFPGNRSDERPVGGVTVWFKQDEVHQATHVHRGPAFLTWHREITNRFEASLREVDPMVSLHYWDWQTDPRRSPDGRGGFVNLFTQEFMGAALGSAGEPWLSAGFYNPTANPFRSDIDFNTNDNPFDPPRTLERAVGQNRAKPNGTPDLGASDADVIEADSFPSMRAVLEGMHNGAHGYIGGTLADPHRSFRDPFVFLLHSNVDRLFALWQLQPGHAERLDPERIYGSESDTVARGRDVGILTPLEPWAGADAPGREDGVIAARPWAAPENEHLRPENQKNSKHPSVVVPSRYDTNPVVLFSLRQFLVSRGLDPRQDIRHIHPPVTSLRSFMHL